MEVIKTILIVVLILASLCVAGLAFNELEDLLQRFFSKMNIKTSSGVAQLIGVIIRYPLIFILIIGVIVAIIDGDISSENSGYVLLFATPFIIYANLRDLKKALKTRHTCKFCGGEINEGVHICKQCHRIFFDFHL